MSSVDELFNRMGSQSEIDSTPVAGGTGAQDRYRLTKKDLIKALDKMPDSAAIWNSVMGQGPEDAKRAIRDALWTTLEPSVKLMVKAPTGEYVESRS